MKRKASHGLWHTISLEKINFLAIVALFCFAMLFTLLVIFEEYRDFDRDAAQMRATYLQQQKELIREETQRALSFVEHEYARWHGRLDEAVLQRNIIDAINALYDRGDGSKYIFVYTLEGININDPNKPENYGKDMLDIEDVNGVKILRELIAAAGSGGFVHYVWEKPTTGKLSPKIATAVAFGPWQWLIGTGVYLDDIDALIAEKKLQKRDQLIKYVMEILTLSAILFALALSGIKLINKVLRDEIRTFSDFFSLAASRYVVIEREQIRIAEFQTLVVHVNAMVDTIHSRNLELSELNASLEQKVRDKTAKLQKEKAFSDQLVQSQDAFIKQSIHEVNTPLAVIMTQIDLYRHMHGEDRYLGHIEAAAKMLHTIFDDLRYMVKKERIDYPSDTIDLGAFLQRRLAFFESVMAANRLKVAARIAEVVPVCINEEELRRLVDNNLSNAIKYAYPDSTVDVELEVVAQTARMRFTTRSNPIDRPEKVFEAFYREADELSGFGLGLHLVKSICNKYGIETEISSEAGVTAFTYIIAKGGCDENSAA
ncbi:cache domain-containing protein [Sulfurimonas sp. HSL-3221]|uniref:sensor histidine kinase n=1 Tax=Thiomicrolovo sulfuroxydans TaxID=2894755 RepID=UPI001E38643A|nr:cache domain-containing protein [Sulfurimonas sp. HSL-3221]UFS61896.1 cache domain-containing protein [Sulfurimonas sp. HSL-3221]